MSVTNFQSSKHCSIVPQGLDVEYCTSLILSTRFSRQAPKTDNASLVTSKYKFMFRSKLAKLQVTGAIVFHAVVEELEFDDDAAVSPRNEDVTNDVQRRTVRLQIDAHLLQPSTQAEDLHEGGQQDTGGFGCITVPHGPYFGDVEILQLRVRAYKCFKPIGVGHGVEGESERANVLCVRSNEFAHIQWVSESGQR